MFDTSPRYWYGIALTAILASLVAAPAVAVDPECVDAITEPPVFTGCQLKMQGITADLRFCTPQFDSDGDPILQTGHLASCTVELDGLAVTVPVTEPGILFQSTVTGKNPGHVIRAWCTTTEDLDGEVWTSDICFPHQRPKKPHKQ
jgi:hypothetical protein